MEVLAVGSPLDIEGGVADPLTGKRQQLLTIGVRVEMGVDGESVPYGLHHRLAVRWLPVEAGMVPCRRGPASLLKLLDPFLYSARLLQGVLGAHQIRDDAEHPSARLEFPKPVLEVAKRIGEMLEDMTAEDEVEAVVGHGQVVHSPIT